MSIEIVSPSDRISQILSDLAKRRATILNVGSKGEFNKVKSTLAVSHPFLLGIFFFYKTGDQRTGTTSRIEWLFELCPNNKLW